MLEGRAGLSRMAVWPGVTSMSRACWFTNVWALVAPIHLPLAQRQPGTEVPDDQPVIPAKPPDAPITGHSELSRWPRLFLGLECVPGRRTPPTGVAAGAWGHPSFLSRWRRTCSGFPWPLGSQGWVREPQIHSRRAGDKLKPGREGAQPRSLDAQQGPLLNPHISPRPSRRGSTGLAPGALSDGGAGGPGLLPARRTRETESHVTVSMWERPPGATPRVHRLLGLGR